jgi:hypothetical protein
MFVVRREGRVHPQIGIMAGHQVRQVNQFMAYIQRLLGALQPGVADKDALLS